MRKLAAVLALTMLPSCAPDEDVPQGQDPQSIDPLAFCAKLPPEEALAIKDHVAARADAALDQMRVGFGIAEPETVTDITAALMAKMLAHGYVASTAPVDQAKAHRVEETGCTADESHPYEYCDGMYRPRRPSEYGWAQVEKADEAKGDTHFTTVFYVDGSSWEAYPPVPMPVEVGVQCGTVTWAGIERDYETKTEEKDGSTRVTYVPKEIPVAETQTFCTSLVFVDGKALYPPEGTTLVTAEVAKDGELSSEWVKIPFDPSDEYTEPFLEDEVRVRHGGFQGTGDGLAYAAEVTDDFDLQSALSCDVKPHQTWISKAAAALKTLFNL